MRPGNGEDLAERLADRRWLNHDWKVGEEAAKLEQFGGCQAAPPLRSEQCVREFKWLGARDDRDVIGQPSEDYGGGVALFIAKHQATATEASGTNGTLVPAARIDEFADAQPDDFVALAELDQLFNGLFDSSLRRLDRDETGDWFPVAGNRNGGAAFDFVQEPWQLRLCVVHADSFHVVTSKLVCPGPFRVGTRQQLYMVATGYLPLQEM